MPSILENRWISKSGDCNDNQRNFSQGFRKTPQIWTEIMTQNVICEHLLFTICFMRATDILTFYKKIGTNKIKLSSRCLPKELPKWSPEIGTKSLKIEFRTPMCPSCCSHGFPGCPPCLKSRQQTSKTAASGKRSGLKGASGRGHSPQDSAHLKRVARRDEFAVMICLS